MNTVDKKNYRNELLKIARNTKSAIFEEWEKSDSANKFFKDKNKMTDEGLLPEGIGASTLLLLLAAFGKDVFSDKDITTCNKVINTALKNIQNWSDKGYLATPILPARNSRMAFNGKDKDAGYVDTVTWCLSSAILARYNEKCGLLQLEDSVREYVFDAIGKGICTLCDAQVNGCWGFRTDTTSPRSLYYTYSVSASLADFFDYILGEIALLQLPLGATEDEKTAAIKAAADYEIINHINKEYNCNISDIAAKTRKSLCQWLVRDALPLFPQVASCDPMDNSARELLGMWKHDPIDSNGVTKEFFHLYYAYYLLDMMVTAGADNYFEEILENPEELESLIEYYRDNNRLSDTDKLYYFYEFKDFKTYRSRYRCEDFFSETVERALYTTRAQYAAASKITDFWTKAELAWKLKHDTDNTINVEVKNAEGFSDPSVIAMALRANITYSYYVTETQDVAIERLFDQMCADIYSEEYRAVLDEDDRKVQDKLSALDLWDCEYYSLPLTERSVEALVDFKDYLDKFYTDAPVAEKFEAPCTVVHQTNLPSAKSALDAALEDKIAEYLRSDAGRKAIKEACEDGSGAGIPVSTPETTSSVNGALPSTEQLVDWMSDMSQDISQIAYLDASSGSELLIATLELFEALQSSSLRKKAVSAELKKDSPKLSQFTEDYEKQSRLLLQAIIKDIANRQENDKTCDLDALYEALKNYRKSN